MRKLASIQKIVALESIQDADAIEKATVLGWQLVVKKGEFKVGDLCVYCEIDSLFPDKPEFEFLKPRGMRIRTIRLRCQISQGICFPLSILPENIEITEDIDCTEILGIVKYEPPIPACLNGTMKGNFPSFIPKTDETRVQVLQKLLDVCVNEECNITEKLDGSSVTYYLKDGEFGVCSRNLELLYDENNSLWKVALDLEIENKLKSLNGNYALQGELIGEGIQGNKYRLKGQTVYFFNLFNIDKYEYESCEMLETALMQMDLKMVPILSNGYVLSNKIDTLVEMSKIKSTLNKDVWAEGIIIRPIHSKKHTQLSTNLLNSGRVSFKVINPEFLIKHGE
jgi:RNA ligase (TIGR02306 family)